MPSGVAILKLERECQLCVETISSESVALVEVIELEFNGCKFREVDT